MQTATATDTHYLQDNGVVMDTLGEVLAIKGSRAQRLRFLLERAMQLVNRTTMAEVFTADLSPELERPMAQQVLYIAKRAHDTRALLNLYSPLAERLSEPYLMSAVRSLRANDRGVVMATMTELAVDHEWRDSPMQQQIVGPLGYSDVLNFFWLNNDHELRFIDIYTTERDGPFSEYEKRIAELLFRAMRPLIDTYLTERAPIDHSGLSEPQRKVLEHAMTGASEKEIARAVHRSPHTIHSHLKTIYRHFGVSGRVELMAMFLDAESDAIHPR